MHMSDAGHHLAPFQAPMIVLHNADKSHVGSIIAEWSILYQGTLLPVTAALPFVVFSHCCSHTSTLALLIDHCIILTSYLTQKEQTDIMAEQSQLEPVKLISLEGKSCFTPGGGWMNGFGLAGPPTSTRSQDWNLEDNSFGHLFESSQTLLARANASKKRLGVNCCSAQLLNRRSTQSTRLSNVYFRPKH